jgi:crotonobetainyl-CoA:carnitine CoA-transferase CaiB-like acyl-CoA transferase
VTSAEAKHLAFEGLRVVELSGGIAASYCGKLFVDAGADVVKLEPVAGDPLRTWRPAVAADENVTSGVLFGFLAAGKKSVVRGEALTGQASILLAGADVVITDLTDGATLPSLAAAVSPAAVVVAVTPFGSTGPYVDDAVLTSEFLLQALCGSTFGRGWPDTEPFHAGGRIGEWVAGTYAAVAAAAGVRHARRTGRGDIVDVSVYEAMVITMGGLRVVGMQVVGAEHTLGNRSLEMPSIVPTADGLVGICTITGQQFQDFLVMIDRSDLLDDVELASWGGRMKRRNEFMSIVEGWAAAKTTDEIVELAVAFRIPVAPIATPRTVTGIDHFVERGVFTDSATGAPTPRVPYRSDAIAVVPFGSAPVLGQHDGLITWGPRDAEPKHPESADSLPLDGVRITDLTAFWAGPTATIALGALGADVIKIEGVRRPDGMRFAGGRAPGTDRWWETGSIFLASNYNKRGIGIELSTSQGRDLALELVARSDLVLENFSPRVMANFGLEFEAVKDVNPTVAMIRMPAFGLDGPWRDRVGFAQTMEQASGMAWLTGFADGPPVIPQGVCDPIAGLHAAFAAIAALEIRDRTGEGLQIESTMIEAALNVAAEAQLEAAANGVELRRNGNRGPVASPQGVYRCAGPDDWVALAVQDDPAWAAFATLIGRPEWAAETRLQSQAGRREHADEIDKVVSAWATRLSMAEAVEALRVSGVGAAPILSPEGLLADGQLAHRGFWEDVEHPVVGVLKTSGLPFTFGSRPRGWVRFAAPTYGQHTDEILTGLLGKSVDDVSVLEATGVVSRRLVGL